MRNKNMIIALVAGGLALATTNLMARNTGEGSNTPSGQPSQSQSSQSKQSGQYQAAQPGWRSQANRPGYAGTGASNLKASALIGMSVQSETGERVGTVKDVVINLRRHSAPFAIVEHGGTFGIGGNRVAVPLTDLSYSGETKELTLNATKAQFDAATSTPTGGWLAFTGQDWEKGVDQYYGQPSTIAGSRFERQEMSGMNEGRQQVRNPASQTKGATGLEQQPGSSTPGTMSTPSASSEQALMTRINSLVRQDQGSRQGDVQVKITKGVVTLSGNVPNESQKQLMEQQIKALPGVERVENHLTIEK